MIDNPIVGAFTYLTRFSEKDHYVIGKFLNPGLMVKEQITWTRILTIVRDEDRIVVLDRADIGILGKKICSEIAFPKRPEIDTKEFFSEGVIFECIGADIGRDAFVSFPHRLKPETVVFSERLPPRKSNQTRAIPLLLVPFPAQAIELHLRDGCKPAPKILPVIERAALCRIRYAVAVVIL